MSKVLQRQWLGSSHATSGCERLPCGYETYVPDLLTERVIRLDGDVAADVADAEVAIRRLDAAGTAVADINAFGRLLLRAEVVASSRIEGVEVGTSELLRIEAAQAAAASSKDIDAYEVLGGLAAMKAALETVGPGDDITPDMLLAFHSRLLADAPDVAGAGELRTRQNWIGGSDHSPCAAVFVPPPPAMVADLIVDLCSFCNGDGLPAVAQAALAHAQFETIHPFADGNGRTGRGLIQLVLRRRGLTSQVVPPISLVLASCMQDYLNGLTATRYRGSALSKRAHAGLNQWTGHFAGTCVRAVQVATLFEVEIQKLESDWRGRVGQVRASSAVDLLLRALPGTPVLTVASAAELIGRTFPAANDAVSRLVAAGVLRQINLGKRNRAFEAREAIDTFTLVERQVVSPSGHT